MSVKYAKYMKLRKHNYVDPLKIDEFVMGDNVLKEIISTPIFERLKHISFLGAIDYTIVRNPNQSRLRYTRYQHSIGVAKLAYFYSNLVELNYEKRQLACIAALLHDLGHAPLSHSLEGIFEKYFNINHHKITKDLITGKIPLGREIFDILKWKGINIDDVMATIDGEENSFDNFFSGPINFDTIEGILRSFTYVGNTLVSSLPETIVASSTYRYLDNSQSNVDLFWHYKNLVYNNIINSYSGVLSDEICRFIMEENIAKFSPDDYLISEPELFKKIPSLKMILLDKNFEEITWQIINKPINYKRRHFFIDDAVDFFSRNDTARYRQGKVSAVIYPPPEKELVLRRHIGDFFR